MELIKSSLQSPGQFFIILPSFWGSFYYEMSALTPPARNMIEMMQGDRILLQSDVLPNLIIIFGENLRRQQNIEKHPFEKENYIILLLTIRSFTKTIISNSFFGY